MSIAVAAGIATVVAVSALSAQDAKKGQPTNPIGSWGAPKVAAEAAAGITLDERQTDAVKRVTTYFNELVNLRGSFVQTSADSKRLRGKFYVKKPGRFRFDYSPPSKQVILSDGRFLRIYDLDLGNDDNYELDNTPFRLLLRKDVDLLRDARITEVQEADDVVVVSLQDKSPDTPGRIRLIMVKKPALELKEWVVTDAQGLDTRMELGDLNKTEDIDANLFKPIQTKRGL